MGNLHVPYHRSWDSKHKDSNRGYSETIRIYFLCEINITCDRVCTKQLLGAWELIIPSIRAITYHRSEYASDLVYITLLYSLLY
jgi:hypothetical protein